ncbi:hypothetical protein [uncultured Aquimarina sp.]|uniref:hypothetical protein n=1 Tax=uncultured Aquimarina sp. TaxID=575652 RepID=UPI002611FEAF|nr:hypothetical protein [uncultured Aquimarina sp.]
MKFKDIENTNYNDKLKNLADLSKKIKQAEFQEKELLTDEYLRQLNDLIRSGWSYALGKENEIDETLLPKSYLTLRHQVIENLQIQLGYCAERYRASASDDKETIIEYHKVFQELIRITGTIIGLDPDSELPDKDMPKDYVDFWL